MFSVNNNDIKERICDYRKVYGATQQDLAIFLDMKRTSYRVKEADGNFDWDETVQIAEFFNVSPYFIRYGVEEEQLRIIAKFLKENDGTLHQPNVSIFDDIDQYKDDMRLYISFLNLDINEQKRIIKYIEANNF